MAVFTRVAGLLIALSLAGPAHAQTCFFADDYSNPARWTQLNSGIEVAGGGVQVTNSSGGSVPSVQRGVFQPLLQPLPDVGGWRLDLTMSYGNVGASGGLLVVAVAAGPQHPLNIFPGGTQTITPQDCIGIITTGQLGARPVPLSLFVSDNGTWHQSAPLDLRLNAVSYLRLERLATGLLKMSVFEDAARTIHQAGSPVCYLPPGQYTGLSTVWHANLPQGSDTRNDQATLDDLCLSTIPVLDTAFTAQTSRTRICLGESLTLTAANPDYAPVSWATTAPNGAAWTATGPSVTYTPPVAGFYTFTASGTLARFCNRPGTTTLTVEVITPDVASVAYAAPTFCQTGTANVASFAPAGGTFSGTPGLVINATTGQINLAASTPGPHVVTYASASFCPDAATAALAINPLDVTTLAYAQPTFCRTGTSSAPTFSPAGGTFTGTPGLVLNPTTGVVNLTASSLGAHVVTYTSGGLCPTTATFSLTLNSLDVAAVNYAQAAYCRTGRTAAPVTSPVGGTFTGTPGLVLNPVTGIVDLAASNAGPHLVTYTSAGLCPTTATFPLLINPLDVTTLAYAAPTFCRGGPSATPVVMPTGGSFSGSPGLVVDPVTGVLNPGASALGGHTVTYTSAGVCPASATFGLTITPFDVVALRLADSVYCQTGFTPPPTVLPPGGTFSSSAGLVFDSVTGVVDLARSAVGRYALTYTSTGVCASSGQAPLRIRARGQASVAYADTTFCPAGTTPAPTAGPSASGSFTGTAGLLVDARTGIVNLATSPPGSYVVTFTPADPCFDPAQTRFTIDVPLAPEFPNIITPNGDGLNETFGLPQPLPTVSSYELSFYNRWGARVHRSSDPAALWTAADVAPGTYHYLLRFTDCAGQSRRVKGVVEVVK